jgi:hypothetical protein
MIRAAKSKAKKVVKKVKSTRAKAKRVVQTIRDRANEVVDTVTQGVATAAGVVVGTVQAVTGTGEHPVPAGDMGAEEMEEDQGNTDSGEPNTTESD